MLSGGNCLFHMLKEYADKMRPNRQLFYCSTKMNTIDNLTNGIKGLNLKQYVMLFTIFINV